MEDKKLQIDLAQLLEDHGVKFKENSSNELIMDQCYNCGRSKKLYVQKDNGLFICFRCDEKGNAVKLVAKYLQISYKEAIKKLYGADAKISASPMALLEEEEKDEPLVFNLGGLMKNKPKEDLLPELKIAPEFVLLTKEHQKAYSYLIKRGYTENDIQSLKLLILPFETFNEAWKTVENRLKTEGLAGEKLKNAVKEIVRCHERIMFPLYVDDKIVGYVARDFTGQKQPKVLNSSGNFRSFSVWNFDNAKNSVELVVCEGNSSAVKCGIDRSVALLGKVMTPGQVKLLRKTKAQKIIICLDVGTDKEVDNIYKNLSIHYPGKIYYIDFPNVIEPKVVVSPELLLKTNAFFKTTWSFSNDLIELPYEDKVKILSVLGIANKLTSDEKKSIFFKRMKDKGFSMEELNVIAWLIFSSEYKDAGDYSHEEMADFIKNAKPYRGGIKI